MARPKQRETDDAEYDSPPSRRRPETGRFHVRVDRQTKSSYETAELAHSAGAAIKARYPVVQVSVFDAEERTTTVIQTPDAE